MQYKKPYWDQKNNSFSSITPRLCNTHDLQWYAHVSDSMIDEMDSLLSSFPCAGKMVEQGSFKGLRCLT